MAGDGAGALRLVFSSRVTFGTDMRAAARGVTTRTAWETGRGGYAPAAATSSESTTQPGPGMVARSLVWIQRALKSPVIQVPGRPRWAGTGMACHGDDRVTV
jgi:hypothetical protein